MIRATETDPPAFSKTPLGETKIPEPMMVPTTRAVPLINVILRFNLTSPPGSTCVLITRFFESKESSLFLSLLPHPSSPPGSTSRPEDDPEEDLFSGMSPVSVVIAVSYSRRASWSSSWFWRLFLERETGTEEDDDDWCIRCAESFTSSTPESRLVESTRDPRFLLSLIPTSFVVRVSIFCSCSSISDILLLPVDSSVIVSSILVFKLIQWIYCQRK